MKETSSADYEAAKRAVLDYVEAVYEADPSKIERSVHHDLNKGGFFKKDAGAVYNFTSMTFTDIVELSKNYNKDSRIPEDAPKDVIIFDMTGQIASVKLVAWWGIDYMHLAKYEDKWMIVNVLWQTYPDQDARLAKLEGKK